MSIADRKFYVSRDVFFHENVFPFAQQQQVSPQILPIPHSDLIEDISLTHTTNTSSDSPEVASSDSPVVLRSSNFEPHGRPRRSHKLPTYLNDYVLYSKAESHCDQCLAITTNLCLQLPSTSSFYLSSCSKQLPSNLDYSEPSTYEEAILHPGW